MFSIFYPKKFLRIFTGIIIVFAMVFFCIPQSSTEKVMAATGEELYFDESGRLIMTTRDRHATSGIKYRTIGWTIKRYPGEIQAANSVRVKLGAATASQPDPEDPTYVYNYFIISAETIFQKISSVSPEWAQDLYQNGGTVYLDAIMTVIEYGEFQGSMTESGVISGEVYTTYEGISTARGWADPGALRSHFDKSVYFGGNPGMLENSGGVSGEGIVLNEQVEYLTVSSEIGPEQLSTVNTGSITSDIFDVTTAIPSSESVKVQADLQKYYYTATYERHYGTAIIPVTANVTYQLPALSGGGSTVVQETHFVERNFSYWKINDLQLSYLKKIEIENQALAGEVFPSGVITMENSNIPNVSTVRGQSEYMIFPEMEVSVNGGVYGDGTNVAALVDSCVGEIQVKNDYFAVDGEVWLSNSLQEIQTSNPVTLSGRRTVTLTEEEVEIPATKENAFYETVSYAFYEPYDGGMSASYSFSVNGVNVHTPVVCQAALSDEIGYNQQIDPTEYNSLILGRNVAIKVSAYGTHIDAPGYGTRSYEKYVSAKQVTFPFVVTYNGNRIPANTWITLLADVVSFGLPVDVAEGDYEVQFRCVAINGENNIKMQQLANLQQENNTATVKVPVTAVGRLYDFSITNVVDYPRWENVFWLPDGVTSTGIRYFSGLNDLNGIQRRTADSLYLVPLIKGSHPESSLIHGPGIGYRLEFALNTIGSMHHDADTIELLPTYYFVDADGNNRRKVNLYYREDVSKCYLPVTLTKNNREILAEGMQRWSGSYMIPPDVYIVDADVNLQEYISAKKGRIKTTDFVFLTEGFLIVQFDIYSQKEGQLHLSYANSANVDKGYCDMWKTEGFLTERVDTDGVVFRLQEGEVMIFDLQHSIYTDYKIVGTH